MDIKDLKVLVKMITETDITEFELENSDEKIVIKRGVAPEVIHYQPQQQLAPMQFATPHHSPAAVAPAETPAISAPVASAEKGEAVLSPIVGTFYRAPAPDAAPYVEVGSTVEKGQVLCIVEAMKLMNEIEAEYRGKVVRICKENAQPVEFGEPLFIIEPL